MQPTNHHSTHPLPELDPWEARWTRWCDRLHALGLAGTAAALLDAVEPLGPLGAQALWIAQPTLSLFMPRGEIGTLAQWLDEPGGIARLRDELLQAKDKTI